MTTIAFLTKTPNNDLITFAEKLSDYFKVFIFVDDNDFKVIENEKINFIQIDNEECKKNNYIFTEETFISNDYNRKQLSSWDKCLYYFNCIYDNYDNIWIIEDDVFIPSVDALININDKYNNSDLITAANKKGTAEDGINNVWHWRYALMIFDEPVYCSMVCCCRLSKKLLLEIKKNVERFQLVPLNEFLFNTLAMKNDMIVSNPIELSTIVFRHDWTIKDFKEHPDYLYHPIKDYNNHNSYRKMISS